VVDDRKRGAELFDLGHVVAAQHYRYAFLCQLPS
jgi:hypothetical protein